jgi:hypothetical protein
MEMHPEIRYSPNLARPRGAFFFWADRNDQTQVRCLVPRRIVDDYFHNATSPVQGLAAIKRHWDSIWPPLEKKIAQGELEVIRHDHGRHMIGERYQTIAQVTLEAQDFGSQDFRK